MNRSRTAPNSAPPATLRSVPPPAPHPTLAAALDVIAQALVAAMLPQVREAVIDAFAAREAAQPPARRLHDAREVGAAIDASRATVYRLVDEGLPYVLVGDTRKFDVDEVVAWLKARSPERARSRG